MRRYSPRSSPPESPRLTRSAILWDAPRKQQLHCHPFFAVHSSQLCNLPMVTRAHQRNCLGAANSPQLLRLFFSNIIGSSIRPTLQRHLHGLMRRRQPVPSEGLRGHVSSARAVCSLPVFSRLFPEIHVGQPSSAAAHLQGLCGSRTSSHNACLLATPTESLRSRISPQ